MVATETERALRESVSNFAKTAILPKVSEMDAHARMDPVVVKALFDQVFHFSPIFYASTHNRGTWGSRWLRNTEVPV